MVFARTQVEVEDYRYLLSSIKDGGGVLLIFEGFLCRELVSWLFSCKMVMLKWSYMKGENYYSKYFIDLYFQKDMHSYWLTHLFKFVIWLQLTHVCYSSNWLENGNFIHISNISRNILQLLHLPDYTEMFIVLCMGTFTLTFFHSFFAICSGTKWRDIHLKWL